MVLKGCFYVGASLYRLCESDIFGVRASFGVDACRVFPQSALAIIFLVEVCAQPCGGPEIAPLRLPRYMVGTLTLLNNFLNRIVSYCGHDVRVLCHPWSRLESRVWKVVK